MRAHQLYVDHHTLKLASSSTEHASCLSNTKHSNWHPHLQNMPAICRPPYTQTGPPYTQTGILIYRTRQLFVDHHTLKLASSSTEHANCLSTTIHSSRHPHLQNMPVICRPPYTQTGILIYTCQLFVDHHTLKLASSSTEHASCLLTTIHSNWNPHLQNTPVVCPPPYTQTGILIYRTRQLFVDHHTLKLTSSSTEHASCLSTTIQSNWHLYLQNTLAVRRPPYTQTGILIYRTCQLFVHHPILKLASSSTEHASCLSTTIHSNWHPHPSMPAVCRPPYTQTSILIYRTRQLFVNHHTLKPASSSTEHASCLSTTKHSNSHPHLQNMPAVC